MSSQGHKRNKTNVVPPLLDRQLLCHAFQLYCWLFSLWIYPSIYFHLIFIILASHYSVGKISARHISISL